MFDIPIVLFTFKRKDTVFRIIERIAEVKPQKVYIISDGPRNEEEKDIIIDVRESIESYISWDCEIIKNYAQENKGVYNRIGEGANWVFTQEETAIFLEDDNLPDVTFFRFCKEMLERYKDDTRVLWVCGTNYLKQYTPNDNSSYVFTKQLLPCGWASWKSKFPKYYDGELELLSDPNIEKRIYDEYENKALYRQDMYLFKKTKHMLTHQKRMASWDRQMAFSIRVHGLYGISPANNQIENIGVDIHSIHGGTSYNNVMTKRFCGIQTIPIKFPLIHPKVVLSDKTYEKRVSKIILYPLFSRIALNIFKLIKPVLGINRNASFRLYMKEKLNKKSHI